jgi:hypothetical protein
LFALNLLVLRALLIQQSDKARLFEVMIGGQRVADVPAIHQNEANRIAERPALVFAFSEQTHCPIMQASVHPDNFDLIAMINGVDKS